VKMVLVRLAVILCVATLVTPGFAQSSGVDVYKSKCVMCHGADGSGSTPAGKALKAASFKDAVLIKATDSDLVAAATKGKGKMPAYEGKLSDAQIKAAIGYIRTLQK